jgi:hypothetical protein
MAAANWMKSVLAKEKNVLPDAAVVLYHALDDPDPTVQDVAAAGLRPLVQALPHSLECYPSGKCLSVMQIAERLTQAPKESNTRFGVQIESEIRELLTPVAGEPGFKESSDTLPEGA